MDDARMYTLLLDGGSHFIDQRAAERVRTALRLNVEQFLINAQVCGSNEPDRLVAVRTNDVVTLVPHDTATLRVLRGSASSGNVVALPARRRIPASGDVAPAEKAL